MALEMCPECSKQISSTAKFCPHCGYTKQFPRKKNNYTLLIGLSLLAFFLYIVLSISWKGIKHTKREAYIKAHPEMNEFSISSSPLLPNQRADGSLIYDEWYKGGILHNVPIKFWEAATYENKLATCADFLYAIDSTTSIDALQKKARKLTRQIDKAVRKLNIYDESTVMDVATEYLGEFVIISEQDVLIRYNTEILDTETIGNTKKSIYVQIPEQLTKQQLEEIAVQLRNENSIYDRLFIFYLLPNTKIGSGAWATSHYNKSLEIIIMGVDKTTENKVRNVSSTGELIGKWYDKTPYIEHSLIISIVNGKYKLKRTFKDGSEDEKDLQFSKLNGKSKFVYKNDSGEYLLIESDGRLSYYDKYGLINTCDKIK